MSLCIFCSYEWVALGVIVYLAMQLSSKFRYYIKIISFTIGSILLASILPLPFFIVRPRDYRNALGPAFGCRWLFRALGVSYEIRGIENIRRDHGGVILMNHQSSIDLAVLAHLWPIIGRATVVSKKALLYAFPFGPASWLWGTIFIDRSNRSNAIDKMNQESVAITKHAAKLLLFPEGTRSQGEKLLPFKKGAFHIAVQSQSIVQPVVISKYHFLDSKNKQFGSGHSIIHILPEIDCKGLTKDDVQSLMNKCYETMQKEYEKLSAETKCKAL